MGGKGEALPTRREWEVRGRVYLPDESGRQGGGSTYQTRVGGKGEGLPESGRQGGGSTYQ